MIIFDQDLKWQAGLYRRLAQRRLAEGDPAGALRAARMSDAVELDPTKWLLRKVVAPSPTLASTTSSGRMRGRPITRAEAARQIALNLVRDRGLTAKAAIARANTAVYSAKGGGASPPLFHGTLSIS